jgi:transposase
MKPRAKLTPAKRLDIGQRHAAGEKIDSIAHDHGVAVSTVSTIGMRYRREGAQAMTMKRDGVDA